jgi:hypothetical protein
MVLANFAAVERSRRRYAEALAVLEQSVALGRQLAYEEVGFYCLLELAALLAAHDDAEDAARLLGAAETLLEKLAVALNRPDEETRAQTLAAVRTALGEEASAEALASGRRMTLDDATELGLLRARAAFAPER